MPLLFPFRILVQGCDSVVECRCAEKLVGSDCEAIAGSISLFSPSDVCLGAGLLRSDVRVELFVGSLGVNADIL